MPDRQGKAPRARLPGQAARAVAIGAAALSLWGLAGCGGGEVTAVWGPSPATRAETTSAASSVAAYDDRRRWLIYTELNRTYLKLWDRGGGPVVATARTTTFKGFPWLRIEDRDRDGTADFFAYHPSQSGGQTMEFGAFFDLARDGSPDWLVFYGGSLLAEGAKLAWWSTHAIDRDNDGSFDTLVIDRIDGDGDGLIEPGRTVWIYDTNFDGRIDMAEHIEDGRVERVPVVNGRLRTDMLTGASPPKVGEPLGRLFDRIAADIAGSL